MSTKILYIERDPYDDDRNIVMKNVDELDAPMMLSLLGDIVGRLRQKSYGKDALKVIEQYFPIVTPKAAKLLNGLEVVDNKLHISTRDYGSASVEIDKNIGEYDLRDIINTYRNADTDDINGCVYVKLPPHMKKQIEQAKQKLKIKEKEAQAKKKQRAIAKAEKLLASVKG